jgi:hypothetical protein
MNNLQISVTDENKWHYYLIIICIRVTRYFLFLTILLKVQKLSISPGNRSIDNPEFLS